MRPKTLATLAMATALLLFSPASWTQMSTPPLIANSADELVALTLDNALALAESANPALRFKRAELAAAEGLQDDAAAWLNRNPEVSLAKTRRQVPVAAAGSDRYREWDTGISQTLEIAGQRGHRLDAAEAATAALRGEIADAQRQMRAEVGERFYHVLALQQRVDIESRASTLFDTTAGAIQKRRSAGEDTRLDANVASVEAERARNQLAVAQEQLLEARSELAARLQLPPLKLPRAVGDLAANSSGYTLNDLLTTAEAQPRVRALAERENSADARLKLERASRYPDITVGASVGREGPQTGRERLTTFSISLPLPLFKRNQAGVGQATTELQQAQIERQTNLRDTRANISALWMKLNSLDARVRRLQESVLPALDDNQTLSLKSQRAGQIGLLEMIVVNRQALDARRDLIDALTEYHATRVALELAAGWPQEGTK
ncbi:MAG: TolC family protein [Xanthomonadaceae bacterium]|nr:TolC family protein [Xanthomonadaceae bacterium]